MALTDKLTAIADAIREKTGGTDLLTLEGMAEAITAIEAGGGGDETSVLDSLIDRNITEYSGNHETVGEAAFRGCTKLTTVNLPNTKNVGVNAFENCVLLQNLNLQNAITIGGYAFMQCRMLRDVELPKATTIGAHAFKDSANSAMTLLTSVNFPLVTAISNYVFQHCRQLVSVNMPQATTIGNYAFDDCKMLNTLDFPKVTNITAYAFYRCSALKTLVLRSETLATLANKNAFNSTPIASGTGYIYVPRELVESYQSATNWSNFANQFRALEDYTVDGTITGELDESKI